MPIYHDLEIDISSVELEPCWVLDGISGMVPLLQHRLFLNCLL